MALSSLRRPDEIVLLGILLAIYVFVYAVDATSFFDSLNVLGPIALTAILGWSCYRMVRRSPVVIWAPLFWFRIACAVYYGFGALVPHIVDEETQQQIYSYFYFDHTLNLKVNLVYCLGIFCTLAFSMPLLHRRRKPTPPQVTETGGAAARRTQVFAICFITAGAILRYVFVVPYSFGLTTTVLPGFVITLSSMYYVGIYLLIVYGLTFRKSIMPLVWLLIVADAIVSIASFAKTELLLILIFSLLGFISREPSKKKLIIGITCVSFAYFAFQPLVMYGRDELVMRYGEIRGARLAERWNIVGDYVTGGRGASDSSGQLGMLRLSYVSVAAFVIDRRDSGMPGETLNDAGAVFVPRLLWPDKPIITRLGRDLYFFIRGRDGSAIGAGHFAEAYWNFGWWGVPPFMAVLAIVLSLFTHCSISIMAYRNWLFLPVVFLGVNIGLRVDGHFVPDIIGAAWMAACLGIGLLCARVLGGARTRHKARLARRHGQFRRAL